MFHSAAHTPGTPLGLPLDRPQTGNGVPASAALPGSEPPIFLELVGGGGIGIFHHLLRFEMLPWYFIEIVNRRLCWFGRSQKVRCMCFCQLHSRKPVPSWSPAHCWLTDGAPYALGTLQWTCCPG